VPRRSQVEGIIFQIRVRFFTFIKTFTVVILLVATVNNADVQLDVQRDIMEENVVIPGDDFEEGKNKFF
jgi:hypothetical protein